MEEGSDLLHNLTTNDGVIITRGSQKTSVLTIEAVKARHRGNYTCYAHNKAGYTNHTAYLSINGHFKFKKSFYSEFCNFPRNEFYF
jgi:hypothetical protein